ncbi:MAG: hypothetical protein H7318_07980 [Oligoflexus sp.]|nr:hypothetical protein [Oligoflexus sp.]
MTEITRLHEKGLSLGFCHVTATVKTWNFATLAILLSFAFSAPLKAEPSVVRYIDDEAGFVLVDQVGSDIKDGDTVCVFEAKETSPTCGVKFRRITRNLLLFPKKELLERWESGTVLDIKKIYFRGKAGDPQPDVVSYNKDMLKTKENAEKIDQTKEVLTQNKFPKGAPPDVAVAAPSIEGDDFPEIFVPKLRKAKKKTKREMTEADATIKSVKKALKDKGLVSYSFMADPEVEEVQPKTVREDYPNPLHGSVEIAAMVVSPILTMATYNSLNFATITNATINRNSLWKISRNKLVPSGGAGLEVKVSSKMSSYFNFGWRYHTFNSLKSRSTFDEFDTTLIAESSSRVSEQVVSMDYGKRQWWTDVFYTSYGLGLDLVYTDLNFQSNVAGNATTSAFVIAYARHNFLTAAPRTQLQVGLKRWGWGVSLGTLIIVPVYNFRDKFTGEAVVPERVNFQGSAKDNLQRSLKQTRNPVSVEMLLSISYEPQRR